MTDFFFFVAFFPKIYDLLTCDDMLLSLNPFDYISFMMNFVRARSI
jgi:hypothetical protein